MELVLAFLELKTHCFLPLFVGLLEIIPYVGNVIGIVLTLIVTALYGADLSMLGGIDLVYGIIQMIQGWVLEPLILGPQVKINPLFTIFALVIGELLWGISGMILAIPMIAMFKIVCDHIEPLKPYGFLIGETETKRTGFYQENQTQLIKTGINPSLKV